MSRGVIRVKRRSDIFVAIVAFKRKTFSVGEVMADMIMNVESGFRLLRVFPGRSLAKGVENTLLVLLAVDSDSLWH